MKLPAGNKVDPEIMMRKTLRKGHQDSGLRALAKNGYRETEAELLKAYPQLSKADLMAV